jgi:hypothetical protein
MAYFSARGKKFREKKSNQNLKDLEAIRKTQVLSKIVT